MALRSGAKQPIYPGMETQAQRPRKLVPPASDRILPLLLVSFGVTGMLLAQQESIWSWLSPLTRNSSRQLVAHFEEIKPPVRSRALGQFSWNDVSSSSIEVRDGDTLYTSSLGNGLLRYQDGLGILIKGNSLVRVEAPRFQGVRRILLSEGETEIRFGASSGPVELVAGNRVVKVVSKANSKQESIITTRFSSRTKGRSLEIQHRAGAEVQVEARDLQARAPAAAPAILSDKSTVAIESKNGVTTARVIADSEPEAQPPAAAPTPEATIAVAPPAPAMTESPRPVASTPPPTPRQKPVPAKATQRKLVASIKTKAKSVKKSSPKMGQVSSEGSTQLGANRSVDLINVSLQWGSVPGIRTYTVQVFEPTGKTFLKRNVPKASIEFDLPSIDYTDLQYQVDAVLSDGSVVSSGRMPLSLKVTAPVPVLPAASAKLPAGETIILSWEKVAGAPAYELSLQAPGRQPAAAKVEKVPENFLIFTPQDPGRYTWRVRAVGKKVLGPWSAPRVFEASGSGGN
jgi:hypothetical protein